MIRNITFLLLFAVTLFSCQKEPIEPIEPEVPTEELISLEGTWVLQSGVMYITNLETNEMISYDHFGPNKPFSSLRYSGSVYTIEDLEEGITSWTFLSGPEESKYGEFWLNMDSIHPYGLYTTKHNWTIIEHPQSDSTKMGGSARPFTAFIEDYEELTANFYIQEVYESIDGQNWSYFSELEFKKVQ